MFFSGGRELIEKLLGDDRLVESKCAMAGLKDMQLLFEYLDIFQVLNKVTTCVCGVIPRNNLMKSIAPTAANKMRPTRLVSFALYCAFGSHKHFSFMIAARTSRLVLNSKSAACRYVLQKHSKQTCDCFNLPTCLPTSIQ